MKPIWLMQPIPYFGEKLKGDWIWEPKIDGWRMQIIKNEDGRIQFWGRRLERNPNWTEKLNYLIPQIFSFLPKATILDAELYTLKGRRMIPSLFASFPKVKPVIFIFDVIYLENEFLGKKPLKERKKVLSELKIKEPFYILKYKKLDQLENALLNSLKEGHEGIVIKEINSPYIPGKDAPVATQFWRKIK